MKSAFENIGVYSGGALKGGAFTGGIYIGGALTYKYVNARAGVGICTGGNPEPRCSLP